MNKIEIAREIFLSALDTMKKDLDLLEFGMDMKPEKFKYVKNQIMNNVYSNLKKLFKQLENSKLITECECKHSLRNGYSKCPNCSGCGFKNFEDKK